jgi:hypothetical protein
MEAPEALSSFPGVDAMRLRVEDGSGLECRDGLAGDFPREQGDAGVMRSAFELTGRMGGAKSAIVCCIASWISLSET